MKKSSSFIKQLFYFSLFFAVLWGNHAWFTWWIGATGSVYRLMLLFLCGVALLYQIKNSKSLRSRSNILAIVVTYTIAIGVSGAPGFTFIIGTLLKLYPLVVLIMAPREDKVNALAFISKGVAFLLIPGLIIYLALLFVEVPGIPILHGKLFYNYVFMLRDMEELSYNGSNALRFMSVFLEPGYLGVLMAFLLMANEFHLRNWYNKVLLISLIASFSLGGYMVALISYGLHLLVRGKVKIGQIIAAIIVLSFVVIVAKNYNEGDNPVNQLIIERLQPSDDGKGIEGNNRFSRTTDYYYEQYKNELLFGLGPEKVEKLSGNEYEDSISGAGYKVYFLTYGIMSAVILLFFYVLLGNSVTPNRKYTVAFLVVLMITFVFQSEITSPSWYLVYFLGCACCEPVKHTIKQINLKNAAAN